MDDQAITTAGAIAAHGISLLAIAASFVGIIPAFVAIIAAFFYLTQLYESKTIQTWLNNRRHRAIARYKARITILERAQRIQAATALANAIETSLPPSEEG